MKEIRPFIDLPSRCDTVDRKRDIYLTVFGVATYVSILAFLIGLKTVQLEELMSYAYRKVNRR